MFCYSLSFVLILLVSFFTDHLSNGIMNMLRTFFAGRTFKGLKLAHLIEDMPGSKLLILYAVKKPKFRVNQRAVKDRYNLFEKAFKNKMTGVVKASGINAPEILI